MKNRSVKKLALRTETLRSLQHASLGGVRGGFYGSTACTNPTLWSDCCKPTQMNCTLGCEQ